MRSSIKITLILIFLASGLFLADQTISKQDVKSFITSLHKNAYSVKNYILMRDLDDYIEILKTKKACVSCDLSNANLKGINLTNANLTNANLTNANLAGADLSGSIIRNANLNNANLQNVNLENAIIESSNLSYANFAGATFGENVSDNFLRDSILTNANFSGSKFFHLVDLRRKNLTGINLTGADLENNDLIGANLSRANLSNANLMGATLQNANLTNANLFKANLKGASLINANLSDTNLTFSNLISTDFTGVDLRYMNLNGANLSRFNFFEKDLTGVVLTNTNLSGANLDGVNLRNMDLTGANLDGVNLRNMDLTGANLDGVNLRYMDLTGANLDGVNLRNMDLTGVNFSDVDLSNKDLSGTILKNANLSSTNLEGIDFKNIDLTGVNLSEVDLSGIDFSSTVLEDAKKITINLKTLNDADWRMSKFIKNRNVTRYDFNGKSKYISTKDGLLFELVNDELRLVLDLNENDNFYFADYAEGGLLGVATLNDKVFVSFTIKNDEDNNSLSLVVDEYSKNFTEIHNIIKIDGFTGDHFAGGLVIDSKDQLYLAVGDADNAIETAQNLNSLKGKILRFNVSETNLKPEIVAYGLRNPWGLTIDSQDRIFVSQCGAGTVEAVYLLDDLSAENPMNIGWPVYEGSQKMIEANTLNFNKIKTPIFEYKNRPGCSSAGVYLEEIETFVHADFYGTIRLLSQDENGEWYSYHEYNQDEMIWGLGLDKVSNKIYVAPKNLELEVSITELNIKK